MPRIPIFYSFHFQNDVFRVQMIRNIGALDDNKPVSANEWESIKRGGRAAVERWINDNMAYRRCVVVLIGTETANREFVKYEIERAWELKKGLLGVYIHNLNSMRTGTSAKGPNPFAQYNVSGQPLTSFVRTYDPPAHNAYGAIASGLEGWVQQAVADAASR